MIFDGFSARAIADKLGPDRFDATVNAIFDIGLPVVLEMRSVEKKYVTASGLTDEEKQSARRTIGRFTIGITGQSIPLGKYNDALGPVMKAVTNDLGEEELFYMESVPDEKLNAMLDIMKALADEANVPGEGDGVDISDGIQAAIDGVLN